MAERVAGIATGSRLSRGNSLSSLTSPTSSSPVSASVPSSAPSSQRSSVLSPRAGSGSGLADPPIIWSAEPEFRDPELQAALSQVRLLLEMLDNSDSADTLARDEVGNMLVADLKRVQERVRAKLQKPSVDDRIQHLLQLNDILVRTFDYYDGLCGGTMRRRTAEDELRREAQEDDEKSVSRPHVKRASSHDMQSHELRLIRDNAPSSRPGHQYQAEDSLPAFSYATAAQPRQQQPALAFSPSVPAASSSARSSGGIAQTLSPTSFSSSSSASSASPAVFSWNTAPGARGAAQPALSSPSQRSSIAGTAPHALHGESHHREEQLAPPLLSSLPAAAASPLSPATSIPAAAPAPPTSKPSLPSMPAPRGRPIAPSSPAAESPQPFNSSAGVEAYRPEPFRIDSVQQPNRRSSPAPTTGLSQPMAGAFPASHPVAPLAAVPGFSPYPVGAPAPAAALPQYASPFPFPMQGGMPMSPEQYAQWYAAMQQQQQQQQMLFMQQQQQYAQQRAGEPDAALGAAPQYGEQGEADAVGERGEEQPQRQHVPAVYSYATLQDGLTPQPAQLDHQSQHQGEQPVQQRFSQMSLQ